jgi:membrane protease YdiL (CAAX protease family)
MINLKMLREFLISVPAFEVVVPYWWYLYLIVAAFVQGGFREKMFFRGFMWERFLARGPVFAVTLSSALFFLIHTENFLLIARGDYSGFLGFSGAFVAALWMGTAFYKSRNLIWPIIMHGFGDVTMYPILHFSDLKSLGCSGYFLLMSACYAWCF